MLPLNINYFFAAPFTSYEVHIDFLGFDGMSVIKISNALNFSTQESSKDEVRFDVLSCLNFYANNLLLFGIAKQTHIIFLNFKSYSSQSAP